MTELDTLEPEPSDATMDAFELRSMADCTVGTFSTVLVSTIQAALKSRDERIAALEARLMVVESRPVTRDGGIWRAGVVYGAGDVVTHRNSGWICHNTHLSDGSQPSHDHFRLFVRGSK